MYGLNRLRNAGFEKKAALSGFYETNSLHSGYVRPKGRTLQRNEFFRSPVAGVWLKNSAL